MEKKESSKKDKLKAEGGFNLKPKIANFSDKILGIIKFSLGLCLLPLVYSFSVSFLGEFSHLDIALQNSFWYGIITLLLLYLFVWEPTIIYAKGQKILEIIFTFFKPLVRVAPYLVPIYLIILISIYGSLLLISKAQGMTNFFVFLFGFSMGLHLIFGAKSLRSKKEDFLKANYIFGFSFVYILNLGLLSLFFNLIFEQFSFVNFCNNSFQAAGGIFAGVFKQLFIIK